MTEVIPENTNEWKGGENCFSVTITGAILSDIASKYLANSDSSIEHLTTFCYIDFFEFQTEPTPLGIGKKPQYNHTIK